MSWEQWVSVIALVFAVGAFLVGLAVLRRLRMHQSRVPPLTAPHTPIEPAERPGPPAFVVNPIKVADPDGLRAMARTVAAELGLPEPLWYTTTVEDPGVGQARAAVEAGASAVVAAGGDGTVRAVAAGLAGGTVPMGLLPMGTGNLLARNLDLPVDGTTDQLRTALGGVAHPIDLGWIRPHDDDAPGPALAATGPAEHLFLVMAGTGFDAAMVAGADDELKRRMGWLAYFFAGASHLHGRKVRVRLTVGEGQARDLRVRSLLFANVGRLPGGFVLFPDAEADDGWLDIAALDTRGGVVGWASLFGKVVLQGAGVRGQLPPAPSSIEFWRARTVQVRLEQPEPVQVDGDLVGRLSGFDVRVQRHGLLVRTRA